MTNPSYKKEPHPLLAQLGGHWDKPFAKLPKKLHAPVRGVFSDAQWDRLDAGRRRVTVSELTDSLEFTKTHRPGRTDKPAAFTVLRPRGGSVTETRPSGRTDMKMSFQETRGENAAASWEESPVLDKCMERESIDQFTFKVLTGCGVGRHGDFIVSRDGVHPVPIDAVVLDRLDDDQREVIDELLALNLIFPCTPTELVVFVDAAQGAFSLPDGYAEKVRSQPAVAEAEKATTPTTATTRRGRKPPWHVVAMPYMKALFKRGSFKSAKHFHSALLLHAGEPDSPFTKAGGHLFCTDAGTQVSDGTVGTKWAEIRGT